MFVINGLAINLTKYYNTCSFIMLTHGLAAPILTILIVNKSVELYATLLYVQALRKPLETDVGITAPRICVETITTSLVSFILKFLRLRTYKMRA